MTSKIKVNTVQPASGTTLTLGTSGDTVTVATGATLVGGGISWQSTIVTGATHTATANQGIWIDTTSNANTLTLPSSPSVGDELVFSDFARQWGANAVTLNLNGSKFQGNTSPNPSYNTTGETVHIVYSGATQGWIPINDGAVSLETPQDYSASYLVVAGGGSGGNGDDRGGGGGAGGYLTNVGGSAITLSGGQVYTITIGAGGAAATGGPNPWDEGNDGNNSVLSGSGISTVTATAGGGGGGGTSNSGIGRAGGSGGGGASTSGSGTGAVGGAGTSPQGNNGGQGSNDAAQYGSAGGGGAGAVGGNGSGSGAGNGGVGLANTITGSSVYYAGGGGGCTDAGSPSQNDGAGGNGGGGAGNGGTSGNATAGTANTGGGGGGAGQATPAVSSGAGGSGVVILSVPTSNYSGTTTGSPTVTTSGSNTIIKFTGSGTYTA